MKQTAFVDGSVPLTGAAAAPHWGLIRASGADAAPFLQSQLTQDFASLGPQDVRIAGFCSAKGRLLASFVAWRIEDDYFLACHHSVLAATLKRLSMFVLRARCRLSDASADWTITGLAGSAALSRAGELPVWRQQVGTADRLIRLPDAAGIARALSIAAEAPPAPAIELESWRWLEVQSGIATIEAATADRFVPQMLNYELIGGVNFQKGCYPGQEVVARSQYRGTIKRRTFLFEIDPTASAAPRPQAGTDVFHSSDPAQPAGMVANAARSPVDGAVAALVEVKSALLGDGSLHLGAPDGALLVRREMPYPLPLETEQAA